MKYILSGIFGALLGITLFAGGIFCGIWYSSTKQWDNYSVLTQELGDTARTMAALQMLDETSPEEARRHLATMVAYQVIALDILLPRSDKRRADLSEGLLARVAEYNRKHPFNLKYPEVEKQLNAILSDCTMGNSTN